MAALTINPKIWPSGIQNGKAAQRAYVRFWPLASIRTHALNGRYWRYSGHWSALALNGSVANDPKRTCEFGVGETLARRPLLIEPSAFT
jgi:hypothetical protein